MIETKVVTNLILISGLFYRLVDHVECRKRNDLKCLPTGREILLILPAVFFNELLLTLLGSAGDFLKYLKMVWDARKCVSLLVPKTRVILMRLVVYDLCPDCLLYTSPSPRDRTRSRMPSSA